MGFSRCLCFLFFKEKKGTIIVGIVGLGVEKWPFRDCYLSFKNWFVETPIFMVFWGPLFGPSGQTRFFGQNVNRHRKLIDNWNAHFLVFFCLFFLCFCFYFCFFVFHLTWPKTLLICFVFLFLEDLTWPLNPPYLFWFDLFCFCFLCWFWRKTCFAPWKFLREQVNFQCLPLFLPVFFFFFPLPFFHSLFLLIFFSYSLLALLLSFCFLKKHCLPCFFAFVSWQEQHQNLKFERFFPQSFLFCLFPVFFCLSNPFLLSLCFPCLKLCFQPT